MVPLLMCSVDDMHSSFFDLQGGGIRNCDTQFTLDIRNNVNGLVFWLFMHLCKDTSMVGKIFCVCLFVFAFVQSMASVFVLEGSNLPEL